MIQSASERTVLSLMPKPGHYLYLGAACALLLVAGLLRKDGGEPSPPRAAQPAPLLAAGAARSSASALSHHDAPSSMQAASLDGLVEPQPEVLAGGAAEVGGVVLDATGGFVSGARVAAYVLPRASPVALTTTDPDGHFVLHVPEGALQVRARAEAYSEAADSVVAPRRGLVLTLTPAGTIAGRIVPHASVTLADAHVFAANQNGLHGPERATLADAEGRFEFHELAAGGYQVWATGADFLTLVERVNVEIAARAEVSLMAKPAASLRATVDVAGQPCTDGAAEVSGPVATTQAIADGELTIEGLPFGRYAISVRCAAVRGGAEAAGAGGGVRLEDVVAVDRKLVERRWSLAPGEVATDPSLVATLQVNLHRNESWRRTPNVFAQAPSGRQLRGQDRGDHLLFADLVPGAYFVYLAEAPGTGQQVVLEADQRAELHLELPRLSSISGLVVDDGGNPVPDAWVVATSPGAQRSDSLSDAVMTDGSGHFTIPELPEANYDVVASCARGDAQARSISAGERQVVLRITDYGSITGVVESSTGEPAESFWLTHRRREDGAGGSQHGYGGTWNLEWLAPGHYELMARTDLGCGVANGTLAPGAKLELILRVSPGFERCELFAEPTPLQR